MRDLLKFYIALQQVPPKWNDVYRKEKKKNYRHLIIEQGFNQTFLFSFMVTKEMFRHWARK